MKLHQSISPDMEKNYIRIIGTMYDFDDSTDIFETFEVGLANPHFLVTNHLATPKLAIFEYWRPNW